MAELVIIYWRDIPAQVIARSGRRDQAKVLLAQRFQDSVDAAAMRAGSTGTDAYLADWRKGRPVPCGADLAAEARAAADALETAYGPARLAALVASEGRDPERGPAP
jgi:hypothetical protein